MEVETKDFLAELEGLAKVEEPIVEPKDDEVDESQDPPTDPVPPTNINTGYGKDNKGSDSDVDKTNEKEEDGSELSSIDYFKQELGYKGDITGDDLETLVNISKAVVNEYKTKASVLDDPKIAQVVDFLARGGDLNEYVAKPQTSDFFEKLDIKEDEITKIEEFLQYSLSNRGIEQEDIDNLISARKDKGTLFTYFEKELEFRRQQEAANNQAVTEQLEAEKKDYETRVTAWIGDQTEYFGELSGITADKEVISKAKDNSLPDSDGFIRIGDILETLSAKDHAKLNIFAVALAEGKPFSYNPSKPKPAAVKNRPINSLLGKDKGSKKEATLDDLERQLRQ